MKRFISGRRPSEFEIAEEYFTGMELSGRGFNPRPAQGKRSHFFAAAGENAKCQFACLRSAPYNCGMQNDFGAGKRALVCDWDGAVFLGDRPLPGAMEFIRARRERLDFYFVTNNTSRPPEWFAARLAEHGLRFGADKIATPLAALARHLRENGLRRILFLAPEESRRHVAKLGAEAGERWDLECADAECQAVAVGFDTELTFAKLRAACEILNRGADAQLIAANADWVCPTALGPVPDAGCILESLRRATGRRADVSLGKPNPAMLADILRKWRPEEIAVAGDRLYTDGALAQNAGCDFVCVLTGETTRADLESADPPPALTAESIADLGRFGF